MFVRYLLKARRCGQLTEKNCLFSYYIITYYNDIVSSRFHWNQASSLLFSCTSCTTCDKLTATKAIPAVNVTLTHTISFWGIAHCITANLVNTNPANENKHY